MSKEIIDGVNVAECRFLDEWKHCDICEKLCDSKCLIVEDIECKTYDDCYYKQLKRLQAENERLKRKKEIASEVAKDNSIFEDWYYELKEENEELKKKITKLSDPRYQIMKVNEGYYNRMKTYKQALEEIREHVKGCCHKFSSNHKDLCYGCEYDKEVCDYSIILDKINEVLDER